MIHIPILLLASIVMDSVKQGDAKNQMRDLQGTWKVVRVERGGRPIEGSRWYGAQFVFAGKNIEITTVNLGVIHQGTYSVDLNRDRRRVSISTTVCHVIEGKRIYSPDGWMNVEGIYEVQG